MWPCITTSGPGSETYMRTKQLFSLDTRKSPPSHAQVQLPVLLLALTCLCHSGLACQLQVMKHHGALKHCCRYACDRSNQSSVHSSSEAFAAAISAVTLLIVVHLPYACHQHTCTDALYHVWHVHGHLGAAILHVCTYRCAIRTCLALNNGLEPPCTIQQNHHCYMTHMWHMHACMISFGQGIYSCTAATSGVSIPWRMHAELHVTLAPKESAVTGSDGNILVLQG